MNNLGSVKLLSKIVLIALHDTLSPLITDCKSLLSESKVSISDGIGTESLSLYRQGCMTKH